MFGFRQTPRLGVQAIPRFARSATLSQAAHCFDDPGSAPVPFPAAHSIYNIACLVFWPRGRLLAASAVGFSGFSKTPLAVSYWAPTQVGDVRYIFGQSAMAVPQGAEYFSLSWLAPPVEYLEAQGTQKPFPEDFFRVVWTLKL